MSIAAKSPGTPSAWQRLLNRTLLRLHLAVYVRRGLWLLLGLASTYGLFILATRLTGLGRDWVRPGAEPWILGCLPVAAGLLAGLWPWKPTLRDAARAVDRHARCDDLFLTMILLDHSTGEFQPLVVAKAEKRAQAIQPRDVAPLRLNRRLALIASALIGFVAVVHFVPQLDPFGKVEASQQAETEMKHLTNSKKATEERLAQIERENLSEAEAKEVKQALDQLKSTMNAAQPKAKQVNAQMLAGVQKNIADQWRKISAEKLRELMAQSSASLSQQFGGNSSSAASKKWLDELQAGSTESLKKELAEMQRDMEELAKTKDPVTRAKLEKKIRERLDALAEFASERTGSKALAAAIKRSQEQMRTACKACEAGNESAAQEAMKAASESTKLADKELQQIAQSAKELKELEKALEVLQMAKRLNGKDALDGGKCKNCQSLADYEALFEKMMKGNGMGDEGFGEGGIAPEDENKSSKFKTEISKSHITKGKVLLTLKTKGMGEHVDVKEQYRSAVRDVKQGISEAILQEEIPPGYHEAIKGYFDSLEEKPKPGP